MAVIRNALTYAGLRSAISNGDYIAGQSVFLQGRAANNDGGQGEFQVVPIGSYVDNDGTILTGGSFAALRVFEGAASAQWWGVAALTDVAATLQAAATAAYNLGVDLQLPDGSFYIDSTVVFPSMRVFGQGKTIFIPRITDASAAIEIAVGTENFSLERVQVNAATDSADFISGVANGQNCTGIAIRSTTGVSYSARYKMWDIKVYGCKVGLDIDGYIGTLENVWAIYCETGLIASEMNSTRAHLRFEVCRKDYQITNCGGLHLDQLLCEGSAHQSGLVSATIDDCRGVCLTAPYFEQARAVPFVTVGGTTRCYGVEVAGLSMGVAAHASNDYNDPLMVFDDVHGLMIHGNFSTGYFDRTYTSTTNTVGILDLSTSSTGSFSPNDPTAQLSPLRNHFPNPNFDMWFRGWPSALVDNTTPSKETTIVRRGENALRLTAIAAQTYGYLAFRFNDSHLGVRLRNRTCTLAAWVWIPDTADFDGNSELSPLAKFYLGLYRDGTGGGTAESTHHTTVRGAWNLVSVSAAIPSDCTRIDCAAWLVTPSGASGSEYCVVDSMYLFDGAVNPFALRHGWITNSELNPTVGIGNRMIMRSDAAPTETSQTFEVGDQVLTWTVAAAGSPGWVCTTGGAGGTAVFKALPAVAA